MYKHTANLKNVALVLTQFSQTKISLIRWFVISFESKNEGICTLLKLVKPLPIFYLSITISLSQFEVSHSQL